MGSVGVSLSILRLDCLLDVRRQTVRCALMTEVYACRPGSLRGIILGGEHLQEVESQFLSRRSLDVESSKEERWFVLPRNAHTET